MIISDFLSRYLNLTISNVFVSVWSEKMGKTFSGKGRPLGDLSTVLTFFFQYSLGKLCRLLGTSCGHEGHQARVRSLWQGGVLISCGFGTNVRSSWAVCTRHGAGHWLASQCPPNTLQISPWLLQFQPLLTGSCGQGSQILWRKFASFLFCFAWVGMLSSKFWPSSISFLYHRNPYKSPVSSLGLFLFPLLLWLGVQKW